MKLGPTLAGAALVAGLSAALASPAVAQGNSFRDCDGFRAPTRTADGLNRRAQSLFTTPTRSGGFDMPLPVDAQFASKGVSACEAALASPQLLPERHLRRASLIRARGFYRLAGGDAQAALADFALSEEAAGMGELLYRRSFGLGTQVLRARALHLAGRRDEAIAVARATIATRSTNAELGLAAANVMLAAGGDWDAYSAALRDIARYEPAALQTLFGLALRRGRFEEALALQPHIAFSIPTPRSGSSLDGRSIAAADNFVRQVDIDGASAFALAALGRGEAAEAALRRLSDRTEAALTEPSLPPGERDRSAIRSETQRHRTLSIRSTEARARVAIWRDLVGLRILADAEPARAMALIARSSPDGSPFALSVYEALAARNADWRAALEPRIAASRHAVEAHLARVADKSLFEIASLLPELENASRVSGYALAGSGTAGSEGYVNREAPALPNIRTFAFASDQGTPAINAEMALLRAADRAFQEGKIAFIVIERRVFQRTRITIRTNGGGDMDDEGYVAEVDVVFVDPAALPAGLEQAGWRVLGAAQVRAQLAPAYQPARTRPRAQARRDRS